MAVATRNAGKVREILSICRDWPVEWVTHEDASWPEVEETGRSYLENATLKAAACATALGIPAVADDSGIEVDALGGQPGMRSARFAGEDATDAANLRLLLDGLRGVPPERQTARYRCVVLCAWPGGQQAWAEATCEGIVIGEPRGIGGFGYDPAFVPAGETRTMAELPPNVKDRISHRGKAFRALRDILAGARPQHLDEEA